MNGFINKEFYDNKIAHNILKKADFDVPNKFRCPISHEIMRDPVCAADGHSYEREEIKKWLSKGISPLNKTKLDHLYLCPNLYLKQNIKNFLESHPQVPETQLIIDLNKSELNREKIEKDIWLGASIDSADENGNTALHLAIQYGNEEVSQLLLVKGASLILNSSGQTPLHMACKTNHLPITEKLLMFHPDLSSKDKFGKTALDYAKEGKNQTIVKLLEFFEKEREKMKIEKEHKNPELHWMQNLSFFYRKNAYGEVKETFLTHADNHSALKGSMKAAEESSVVENTNDAAMQIGFFYTSIAEKEHEKPYLNVYSIDVDKHEEKYFNQNDDEAIGGSKPIAIATSKRPMEVYPGSPGKRPKN